MPTIISTIVTPPAAGTPGKGSASLLATGEPGFDFQTLLGATAIVVPPAAGEPVVTVPPARPSVAADGTMLPVEVATKVPGADVPVEIMPVAKVVTTLLPAPPVEEPTPVPEKIVSSPAVPMAAPRQLPIVSTKTGPKKDEPDPSGDSEEPETPADPPIASALPIAPVPPFQTPPAAKAAPLPVISVARSAPAAPPVVAAAMPQITRDVRWDGATPIITPLAALPTMPLAASETASLPTALPLARAGEIVPPPLPSAEPAPAATMQLPATALPVPMPAAIVVGPALQVFGAAISAAARHERGEEAADPLASLGSIAAPAPLAAPTAVSSPPTLDMRQERWPQAMIAHIEALRDTADAGDTRIRLIPDALGTIDVAVTRDRDTVHVQFTAEQATTRTLIQDAQPRLAALAEERGLRLGQTVVDAGSTGSAAQQSPQQRQPQRDAALPAAPRRHATNDDQDRADDGRLA